MKKNAMWYVEKTHSAEQYNDTDTYTLFNYDDEAIAKDPDGKLLTLICKEHNKCILELTD